MPLFPVTPTENSRRIRVEIRRVFMEWDPIGINDEPNCWNEYDGYISRTVELLFARADDQKILEYLDLMVRHMGMDGSRMPLAEVVRSLRKIDLR